MARQSWPPLMLLLITWTESMHCSGLTVDPPEDVVISDPGHLGHLQITWSPPASVVNMTDECTKLYQLEYYDTYSDSWTAIRTDRTSYSAQFDLMKDVRVRVYTLLNGPCTSGKMIKSTNYTELVQKPPPTGVVGIAVHDFVCVYHDMMYMECNWGRNLKLPANSRLNLYFWHKNLERAEECPKYVITSGTRSGCNFTGNSSLPEFTDINLCVNGSSPEGALKPIFISLRIQNHVKPKTVEKVYLQAGPGVQLEVHWKHAVGKVPGRCLEWEVEHNHTKGLDGKMSSRIPAEQMRLTLSTHDNERHCVRVRSKLSKYCARKSFWSEWSRQTCHPAPPQPGWDKLPVYVYITIAVIPILLLPLCVGAVLITRIARKERKMDSMLKPVCQKFCSYSE